MELFREIYAYVEVFFILYLVGYSTFLLISVLVGAIELYELKQRESLNNYIEHDYYISISIVVPAFNESVTIIDTVNSLLMLDYRLYEILVVDDGSTDDTSKYLIEYFHLDQIERPIRKRIPCKKEEVIYYSNQHKVPITLIRKENGGKADSLNMGINASEYPYFVCMDADSVLQHDALINIARPIMERDDVVACGGLVRIINDVIIDEGRVVDYRMPKNILLCMQILEYDRTFLASRLFFDKFNGNLIISGAFGVFKKDVVVDVGGYDVRTMGEDMELVVRLHAFCRANKIPYSIRYAPYAICWSQAPNNFKDLLKQRKRWHIGLFQSIKEHRQLLFNTEYGLLSFVSFIYFVVYELLSPYIEVFGVLTMVLAYYFNLINVPYMIMFLTIYILFNGLISITAFLSRVHALQFKLTGKDFIKAVLLCLIENIGLRTLLAYTRMFALVKYKKNKHNWGKIKREEYKKGNGESK